MATSLLVSGLAKLLNANGSGLTDGWDEESVVSTQTTLGSSRSPTSIMTDAAKVGLKCAINPFGGKILAFKAVIGIARTLIEAFTVTVRSGLWGEADETLLKAFETLIMKDGTKEEIRKILRLAVLGLKEIRDMRTASRTHKASSLSRRNTERPAGRTAREHWPRRRRTEREESSRTRRWLIDAYDAWLSLSQIWAPTNYRC